MPAGPRFWRGALTPWDAQCGRQSAGLAAVMVALAVLVTAVTDEGGVSAGERVARVLPVVPVCVALAVGVTLAGARRATETRALQALGRSPFANAWGAAVGAGLVGLAVALLVLLDARVPVGAFFPTVHASGRYAFDGEAFSNVTTHWRVSPDGTLALPAVSSGLVDQVTLALPAYARLAAALVIAVGGAAFGVAVAALPRTRRTVRFLGLLATAAATTFCLQAAAAGRLPALVAPIPSTLLLLMTAWAIVRAEWEPSTK